MSFCFLWRRDQSKLLDEMIARGINAILIKTATMGLSPQKHCGRTIAQLQSTFEVLVSNSYTVHDKNHHRKIQPV